MSDRVADKVTHKTRDKHGNRTRRAEDTFRATLKGGGRVGKGKQEKFKAIEMRCKVRPNGDGTFLVTYAPPIYGAYSLKVEWAVTLAHDNPDDMYYVHMGGSPFQLRCAQL
eukprot:6810241-Pyramimonas_sp.AAC.2